MQKRTNNHVIKGGLPASILTSERLAEHQFAGQNTQHMRHWLATVLDAKNSSRFLSVK